MWPATSQTGETDQQDEQQKMLLIFTKMYRAHYDKFIKALSTLSFQDVESIWIAFWQQTDRIEDSGTAFMSMTNVKFNLF